VFFDQLDELRRGDIGAAPDTFQIEPTQGVGNDKQWQVRNPEDLRLSLSELEKCVRAHHGRHQTAFT
jgi:hypothetical protein